MTKYTYDPNLYQLGSDYEYLLNMLLDPEADEQSQRSYRRREHRRQRELSNLADKAGQSCDNNQTQKQIPYDDKPKGQPTTN